MHIGQTKILDTHAEAFSARYTRLVITAIDEHWVDAAVRAATGYATSVIGCDCEAGVDRIVPPSETPDGRPGASVLFFAFTTENLADAVANRVGQCVLTCPTTACFNDLPDAAETIPLGEWIRFFGDGYESREQGVGGRESEAGSADLLPAPCPSLPAPWRIPVLDGEFLVDDVAGVAKGIGGGNLILHADSQAAGLAAAQRAAGAVAQCAGVIAPFPGGICRAGSKVGSRYEDLIASTDETYCPSLRDEVGTQLVDGATCAYEIVINGVDLATVREVMRTAIEAAAGPGLLAIGARSFDSKLGKHNIRLHELFGKP